MKDITFDIKQMVELRIAGWGYTQLGRHFNKDHSTIMYHCRRIKVEPNVELTLEQIAKINALPIRIPKNEQKKTYKYDYLLDEPINRGKSYKQYLLDSKKRPVEQAYYKQYEARLSRQHKKLLTKD